MSDGSDPPGAISRAKRCVGFERVPNTLDLDPARPATELGEARVVEDHPLTGVRQKVRLLNRSTPRLEADVGPHLRCVHDDPMLLHRLEHLNRDRSDVIRVASIEGRAT